MPRLSLTARCTLVCPYCLPDGSEPPGLLSQAQRLAVVEAAVDLGARRLRLTGGEPLVHSGLEALIAAAAPLRAPDATVPSPRTSRSSIAPAGAPSAAGGFPRNPNQGGPSRRARPLSRGRGGPGAGPA